MTAIDRQHEAPASRGVENKRFFPLDETAVVTIFRASRELLSEHVSA